MSGPIVRKYGFPNFDKIFGPKPVLHGADDEPEEQGKEVKEPAPAEPEPARGREADTGGPAR